MFRFFERFFKSNELDRILTSALKSNHKRFLIAWNRALGDIPLGLYAFVERVKGYIPDAEITFITRQELEEAFYLLDGVKVIGVPWWRREDTRMGKPTRTDIVETLDRLRFERSYDVIIERVNPTRWLNHQHGKVVPRLRWDPSYDQLWKRFEPLFTRVNGRYVVGVHIESETQGFYGYKKDWDIERWEGLFDRLGREGGFFVVLFGLKKREVFREDSILDLRGETTILELLSVIKNCCNILIAPDSGVLSLTYYLDVLYPILIISLWGPSNHGVLKQRVASPNRWLRHIPLIGQGNDISRITVDEVYKAIKRGLSEPYHARER